MEVIEMATAMAMAAAMNQMGSVMNQQGQPDKPKEIPADVTAGKIVEEMKQALNLDELQAIAIKNVLIESLNAQGRILKQDSTQDEQIKDFQALSENTDRKINQFLNKEQKEKYLIFKEERKNQKKSKDKSKSKTKDKPKEKEKRKSRIIYFLNIKYRKQSETFNIPNLFFT